MSSQAIGLATRIGAADELLGYQWTLLKHLWREVGVELGARGRGALSAGFERYGQWVAEQMLTSRQVPTGSAADVGQSGSKLLAGWPSLEFALAAERGELVESEFEGAALTTIAPMPGYEQLAGAGCADMHRSFWRGVFQGISRVPGVDWDVADVRELPNGRWEIQWASPPGTSGSPPSASILRDPAGFVHGSRATLRALAAIEMYVYFEIDSQLGATGEEALGRAIYAYDEERARGLRAEHDEAGLPRTIASLTLNNSERRDPYHAMFGSFADKRISDGLYGVDVYFCPLADVWASEGPRGLAAGYLYDTCSHRGLFESYLPGTIVKWDSLKTKGDHICRFRVVAPDLLNDDDRHWLAEHAPDAQASDDPRKP